MVSSHPSSLTSSRLTVSPLVLANLNSEPVSELLYSGFLEHVGRCIYGGIVDSPKHPSPAKLLETTDHGDEVSKGRLGWRKDVVDLIGKKGDLEVPMLRWPGVGTGTLNEALAWLEYCNGVGDTHWANLRRKHTGRHEPHNIKYWGLGNEMWGPWQVGNLKAADYAERARIWAHGLRLVDPTIKLVSCGREGNDEWDEVVLKALIGSVDMHSIHFYSTLSQEKVKEVRGLEYENNVFGPAAADRSIQLCKAMINKIKIEKNHQRVETRPIKVAFDEWNVWDEVKAPGSGGLEQSYDFTDMLGFVAWLNLLVRNHQDLGLACLAQTVNVISPVMTRPDAVLKQVIYYPLRLFSRNMKGGHTLHLPPTADVYNGVTYPLWIQEICPPSYIDTCAMAHSSPESKKISIRLSILNRHPTADWTLDLRVDDMKVEGVEVHEMWSDDLSAKNTFEDPERILPQVTKYSAKEWAGKKRVVRAHSWQFIFVEGTKL